MNMREWVKSEYAENLEDIALHGCSAGVSGLIYYSETAEVYEKYQAEIWEAICFLADETGETPLQFIANFNGAGDVYDDSQFKNLLVWFAVENFARELLGW